MNAVNQFLADLAADPTVGAVGLAVAGALVGLWLAAAWWAFSDMSRRSTIELARLLAPAWILLSTPFLLPLSLGSYLLARPQRTVAERRAERLFEALDPVYDGAGCEGCGAAVDPTWHRCPTCATWLASTCRSCGEWSAAEMDLCPFCAHDKAARPARRGVVAAMAATVQSAVDSTNARPADGPPDHGLAAQGGLLPALSVASAQETSGMSSGPAARRRSVRNRGARDLRRATGADRYAGSGPMGIGS
jgi:hypothetical protein